MNLELRKNKTSLLLIAFLLIKVVCSAQTSAVQLTKMNLLYKGIENPFRIAINGIEADRIVVKTSDGLRLLNGNRSLMVRRSAAIQQSIFVGQKVKHDTVWLDTFAYRIQSLPQPSAMFGDIPNNGLPVEKLKILNQTKVSVTMGRSFVYDLPYEVLRFKLIIAYQHRPAVMMSSSTDELTGQMQRELAKVENGDRILIEGIKVECKPFGFKANLPPIIITVRSDKPNSLLQDNELVYYKIHADGESPQIIHKKRATGLTIDTLKTAMVDAVFQDGNGFKRTRLEYKEGVIVSKHCYDDRGILIFKLVDFKDNKWRYTEYYNTGETKITCVVSDSLDYIGNTAILECDNYIMGHCYGQGYQIRCDSLVHYSDESDIHEIKYWNRQNPIGEVNVYYPNGNLKSKGILVYGLNRGLDSLPGKKESVSEQYPYHFSSFKKISVMHGNWEFYDKEGILMYSREYKKGAVRE